MGIEPMTCSLQENRTATVQCGLIVDFSTTYLDAHSLSPFLTKFQHYSIPEKIEP